MEPFQASTQNLLGVQFMCLCMGELLYSMLTHFMPPSRQTGQSTSEEIRSRDLRRDLEDRERESRDKREREKRSFTGT